MNIEQLQYICMVARTNSITTAADRLYVTQQTISKAVNKLETELGVKLLDRSYKGVTLTEQGELFVDKANAIVDQFQELYHLMCLRDEPDTLRGEVKLYASSYFMTTAAPELFVTFCKLYPEVSMSIEERLTKEVLEIIPQTDDKIGIISLLGEDTGIGHIGTFHDKLEIVKLHEDKLIAYVAKNNPLARHKQVSLKELCAYPTVLSYTPGFDKILSNTYGVKLKSMVNSSNSLMTHRAVLDGLAVGFITEKLAQGTNLSKDTTLLSITEEPNVVSYYISPRNYVLNEVQIELVKEIKRIFKNI